MIETTVCPECGKAAATQWHAVLDSTDGPIEHARILCADGHWFLLPVATIGRRAAAEAITHVSLQRASV